MKIGKETCRIRPVLQYTGAFRAIQAQAVLAAHHLTSMQGNAVPCMSLLCALCKISFACLTCKKQGARVRCIMARPLGSARQEGGKQRWHSREPAPRMGRVCQRTRGCPQQAGKFVLWFETAFQTANALSGAEALKFFNAFFFLPRAIQVLCPAGGKEKQPSSQP